MVKSTWWPEPIYVGATLGDYERNGYEDSDWYAIVWDENEQCVKEIEYMTTRAPGSGYAEIDATPEVMRKVFDGCLSSIREAWPKRNERQARVPEVGKLVTVKRGRKVRRGLTSQIAWMGNRYNQFSGTTEDVCGLWDPEAACHNVVCLVDYVEVVDWQDYLKDGDDAENEIRGMARRSYEGITRRRCPF